VAKDTPGTIPFNDGNDFKSFQADEIRHVNENEPGIMESTNHRASENTVGATRNHKSFVLTQNSH